MKITMIGHSTVLIETAGQKILTDTILRVVGQSCLCTYRSPGKTSEETKGCKPCTNFT